MFVRTMMLLELLAGADSTIIHRKRTSNTFLDKSMGAIVVLIVIVVFRHLLVFRQ